MYKLKMVFLGIVSNVNLESVIFMSFSDNEHITERFVAPKHSGGLNAEPLCKLDSYAS